MSTLTRPAARRDPARTKPRRLRGLAWLMFRQHRVAFALCAAATVLGTAYLAYERGAFLDTLNGATPSTVDDALRSRLENRFDDAVSYLAYLPILFGAFFGAPLIASDREQGTARLVTTQSVPRMRWLLAKLGFALGLVAVTTGTLSAVLSWYWSSAHPFLTQGWLDGDSFTAAGPVLAAMTLFLTTLGIAIGTLVRRAATAMTLTFVASGAFLLLFDYLKPRLATPHRMAFPLDTDPPAALSHVYQVDQWVGTASGKVYGYGTCVHSDMKECRARLGIVNSVWDYFTYDQRAPMQWTAAGLLLGGTAVLVALIVWRARRRAF
ncbi:ABC transporter permease [Streptomyces sp. NPDC059070]|uniref:ABC transporter permease n=1 Tax=unclassified Streptomyces TaxID=2593676 RepID=UPI0034E25791